ncbi:hypothetical protein CYY_001848 [Polysphondylium violaceum]|uniref:Type A von Willebrand factor domain-containing protein n=1 Tax=Polysphondylium violaceum TaxID=133409 RepID=A0A8J4Q0C5_9MYCE|nr:hypothetical protein CYY_001848 [Polysphondylium violaceum]
MKNFISNLFTKSTTTTSNCSVISSPPPNVSKDNIVHDDYTKSSYFNFYRILETNRVIARQHIGLTSSSSSSTAFVLEQYHINAEMTDTCTTTVLTQKYKNTLESPVEAKYCIPLPPFASVSNFVVEFKDQVLKATIKERQKAENQYSDTIASGGQSFLASKSENGLFTLQLGNVPQGESVTLHFTIISEIGSHYSNLHYFIHKYWFPSNQNFDFKLSLNIGLSNSIKEIQVKDYKNTTTFKDESKRKALVEIENDKGISNDLLIIVVPESSDKPLALVENDSNNNSTAIALNFYPNFEINSDEMNQKSTFIFLIDCSGSMEGDAIKKAKTALDIIMRSLNENCKFNIYCFGSNFNKCFEHSRLYDDESLTEANNYISNIDADMGGTELFQPIKEILQQEYDQEYPRQLFILTDGCVSSRDELIKYVGTESNSTRIFTLGIGSGVDKELVIGLSNSCKGFYELIDDNNDMQNRVMKLVNIAMEPAFSNIKVDWGIPSFVQSPQLIRPIFYNERMMIYALSEKKIEKQNFTITITGNSPSGKQIEYSIPIDLEAVSNNDKASTNIHSLAAFKIIHDLEYREKKKSENNSEEIIRLSKKYSIISTKTSFIVSVESDQPTTDAMVNVDVLPTTSTPDRLGGGGAVRSRRSSNSGSSEKFKKKSISFEQEETKEMSQNLDGLLLQCESLDSSSIQFSSSSQPMKRKSLFSFTKSAPSPVQSSSIVSSSSSYRRESGVNTSNNDQLVNLIKLQKALGSWDTVNSLFVVPSKPSEISDEAIWTTIVVIAKIMKSFENRKTEWDLVVQKATKWVKNQLTKNNISIDFNTLLESAKSKL